MTCQKGKECCRAGTFYCHVVTFSQYCGCLPLVGLYWHFDNRNIMADNKGDVTTGLRKKRMYLICMPGSSSIYMIDDKSKISLQCHNKKVYQELYYMTNSFNLT